MTNEELCTMIQNGTDKQKCLEQLYTQNTGMIERIIKRYQGIEEIDDLRQEAYFGIARAAELWKQENGASFIHYAAFWIKQVVRRYIDDCGGVVRVPSDRRALIGRYHRTVNAYRVQFGRDPSNTELCFALDLSRDRLKNLKRDILALNVRSTAENVSGNDEGLTLEDTIATPGDPIGDVIERIQAEQLTTRLWSEVDRLPPQQAAVIRGRYRDGCTLKECGAALGVSTERARQIEANAMRELRKPTHARRLMPFITLSGAYSMGIRHNSYSAFDRYGSTQERAIMYIEERAGVNYWGNAIIGETLQF